MRAFRLAATWTAAAAVAVLGLSLASRARAGDEHSATPKPPVQKPVKTPLFDGVMGSYTTTSKGMMGEGKGKVSMHLAIGGTAVIEEYESTSGMGPYAGHGVYRVGDDGKSVSIWWFDSMSPKPMTFTGTLTDTAYDATGDMPDGSGKMRITLEKKGDAYEFRGLGADGKEWMAETWTRAK